MVRVYFEYHNPVCDCCGHTLGAERDDEAAEAAMKADGWHKVEGKDLCRLCWQHYEETGRMPRKLIFYKEETNMEEVSNKKDLDVVSAYLQNIARVARESAMAWVRVAAIAEKAGDEL